MDQLEEACGADYTFIGDNIDFLVKIVGSTKSKRNKLYHWFHLIGITTGVPFRQGGRGLTCQHVVRKRFAASNV